MSCLIFACSQDSTSTAPAKKIQLYAEVLSLNYQNVDEKYVSTGTLITDDRVDIASRMMGFIKDMRVKEGDRVSKDQLLLTIDPTEIEARLVEANARLSQAKAHEAEARIDFDRFKKLFEKKLVAANLFTKAELGLQLASQEHQAAKATVERIKIEKQYAELKSPVSGIVINRHKQAGDIAIPGTAILTIEDPDNIVLKTYIKEDLANDVVIGKEALISVDAINKQIKGIVTQVVPATDAATHSFMVKITPEDTKNLRTGMFARAEFIVGFKQAIVIPAAAIHSRADIPGVYIVDDQDLAHFRMIRTGRILEDAIEVVSGLHNGDRIVISSDTPIFSGNRILSGTGSSVNTQTLLQQ